MTQIHASQTDSTRACPPTRGCSSCPSGTLWIWVVAIGVLSCLAASGSVSSLDQQVAWWVTTRRAPFLDVFMKILTFFGSSVWTALALAGMGVYAFRRVGPAATRLLFLSFLTGAGLEVVLRFAIPHWRPDAALLASSMTPWVRFNLAGFPSGHAFRAGFVFGWLAGQLAPSPWRRLQQFSCVALIGMVGFTRVYLNRHWASDVLGGWLVALLALSLVRSWRQAHERRVAVAAR